MNENLEIEYKMLVSEQEFSQLRDLTGVDQVLVQSNVYYDCTPSSTLKQIAMRIRDVRGKHLFTMKIPQAQGVREIEMELPENSPEAFDNPEIRALFDKLGLALPVHVCGQMITHRHLRVYPLGELCLDHSLINGRSDYEIEFEVTGDPQAGKAFFLDLLSQAGLTYRENRRSKYARCVLDQ